MLADNFKCVKRLIDKRYLLLLFLLLGMICVSCHSMKKVRSDALSEGFKPLAFKAGGFEFSGLLKNCSNDGGLLSVYIEGDGFAWKNRYTVSNDPTPRNPITLNLALHDKNPDVFYLPRPCQFTNDCDIKCESRYWTTHRYSEEVIDAMDKAVSYAKQKTCAKTIKLIGFSGGGTVAVLIAARRDDVVKIITVSANLDHVKWTQLHKITPLYGSLNASDFAQKVQGIDQVHFVGGDDDNVSKDVITAYYNRMSENSMTNIIVIDNFTHSCCWVDRWQQLLSDY
ncbi:MAG: hypothetical protein B6I31_04600 [Desulfobacteraceae bacterium 4572_19]|nr:MAG: hypothetical protein B6I31_04600 [Desulfobacteraceae bacterium 4572_19]